MGYPGTWQSTQQSLLSQKLRLWVTEESSLKPHFLSHPQLTHRFSPTSYTLKRVPGVQPFLSLHTATTLATVGMTRSPQSYGQKEKGKQNVLIKQVAPSNSPGSSYFHQTTILTSPRSGGLQALGLPMSFPDPPAAGPLALTQPPTCPTRIAAPWAALHAISSLLRGCYSRL